jgi:MFS transporter, NNP family, nitrate/nitrite transporter
VRIREIWIIALITLLAWGSYSGFNGYLPLYLRNIGWTPLSADSAMTAVNGAMMAGNIPMVLIASRFTGYKTMLFISTAIAFISMSLMMVINGTALWPLLIISAFLRAGASAVTNVMLFETPGIGSNYAGTAMGLVSSIGMIGAFLSPPIGNSFASINPAMPFLFWGCLAMLSLPLFLLLRKTKRTEAMNPAL